MDDLATAVETAISYMRDGAVQLASETLSDALVKHHEAQIAAGNEPPPPPPSSSQLLGQILTSILHKLGTPPDLEAKIISYLEML